MNDKDTPRKPAKADQDTGKEEPVFPVRPAHTGRQRPKKTAAPPTRDDYRGSDYAMAYRLLRDWLIDGDETDLINLKGFMDKTPLAFNNFEHGESVLFNVISTMLQERSLCEATAAQIAGRLEKVMAYAKEAYGNEFVHRMVNSRSRPESIVTDNHLTVRDLMEKGKMMSYVALREFFEIFKTYKFETTNVRGL